MLAITLLKSLYHEMDVEKIPDVEVFTNEDASKYHKLAFEVPDYPDIRSITAEVRYMAYGIAMYYLHLNEDLDTDCDIESPEAKAALLSFFRTYQPSFVKPDLPEDLSDISTLDCFLADQIPDYRPPYAFPGLILYDDLKSGKVKADGSTLPSFPGLRLLNQDADNQKPAYISNQESYTEFHGNEDDFQKKLEELKLQFKVTT